MQEPGTIPVAAQSRGEPDTDRDGMPDEWEKSHGSLPDFSDPWSDADDDGVANIEEWLEQRHIAVTTASTSPGIGK